MVGLMGYRPGEYFVICDQCGRKKYRSQCRYQWDNILVCSGCYDPRHPQLDIVAKHESAPADMRPEVEDEYLVDTSLWGAMRDANDDILYDAEGEPIMPHSNQYGGS